MNEAEERALLLARIGAVTDEPERFEGLALDRLRHLAERFEYADQLIREKGRMAAMWQTPMERSSE
jgi:hypothetical protein